MRECQAKARGRATSCDEGTPGDPGNKRDWRDIIVLHLSLLLSRTMVALRFKFTL